MIRSRRHAGGSSAEEPGQDSFLDIVANMVGILIMLVMVVGVRAARAPSAAPTASIPAPKPKDDLSATRSRAVALASETRQLLEQAQLLDRDLEATRTGRQQLKTFVTAAEQELARQRASLDDESRKEFDLRVSVEQSHAELDRLTQQRIAAASALPETVEIESLPTPLSKTVDGKEVHFQFRGGRLVHVPLAALLDQFKAQFERQVFKLQDQPALTETVGPLGGFRLRYQLRRFDLLSNSPYGIASQHSVVRLVRWDLLPVSSQLGETIEEALAPDSDFRRVLASLSPQSATITVWTYPDGFEAFGRVKKELFAQGFATAARPLPAGVSIGGSPEGSRSAAQ